MATGDLLVELEHRRKGIRSTSGNRQVREHGQAAGTLPPLADPFDHPRRCKGKSRMEWVGVYTTTTQLTTLLLYLLSLVAIALGLSIGMDIQCFATNKGASEKSHSLVQYPYRIPLMAGRTWWASCSTISNVGEVPDFDS
ncbi:hypothetical protein AFLA_005723 [Aspergillus flavus NRRL3357]|nr:hypothetical protein AFLA_005723 [Aspergillus flavus NRRL3357]